MGFETDGERSVLAQSPGGFEFGLQGWVWGEPRPKSITFFLDNTAAVCDQYGRRIRRAVGFDGREIRFADTPPEASYDEPMKARPQFATHAQTIAALESEGINWLAYEVVYRDKRGNMIVRGGLKLDDALGIQTKLVQEQNQEVLLRREVVCAGWPQLPYDQLKKLPEIPPTPVGELEKIIDPKLRQDALRFRQEVDGNRAKEREAIAG